LGVEFAEQIPLVASLILKCEKLILDALNFNAIIPTSYEFLLNLLSLCEVKLSPKQMEELE
jgi:hypothetical protein